LSLEFQSIVLIIKKDTLPNYRHFQPFELLSC
jgi:hypothetical protein